MTGIKTVIQSLIKHVRQSAMFNPNSQMAPVCILWPDKDRQWEGVIFAGRHREALPILATAIRLDPSNPEENLSLMGLARFMLKDTVAAVTILEQARASQRDIKPSGPTVSLMSAYAHLGRTNDAQRMVEEIRPIWIDKAQWYASGLLQAGVCCEQDLVNVHRSKQE